jgi:diguanylate cyclase (GGDEF)-like protein
LAPTESARARSAGNLPTSLVAGFTNDDLALVFGTCLPHPVFVVDSETALLSGANQRFFEFLSRDPATAPSEPLPWEGFIHPEDRGIFRTWERTLTGTNEARFDVRFLLEKGAPRFAHVVLTAFHWKQRRFLLGFVEEVSEMERVQADWKRQLEEQKTRAFEAIKSSLRLYQLNEKIRRTPQLARQLLHTSSESELFERAAKLFTSEEGLGYRDASFLLLDGSMLQVVYSTQPGVERTYSLTADNRFARFMRKNTRQGGSSGHGFLLPLESRGDLLGFCEVIPHSKEKLFFDEMNVVNEWQRDVLFDIGGIIALIIDNLRLNREIQRRSVIDSLTQAYNRHYFVDRLATEVDRAIRYERPVSLLFVDLDEFKLINDRYGHLQGDEVLRSLGKIFRSHLREIDVVCRFGGDEFVVLLPETDLTMAKAVAEKLLKAAHTNPVPLVDDPKQTLPITVSMGLSSLKPGDDSQALLKAADLALYRAKSLGRNRLEISA